MILYKGQRWMWDKYALVEVLEDSREFSPDEEVSVKAKRINGWSSTDRWSFGSHYQKRWEYLQGQDRPID